MSAFQTSLDIINRALNLCGVKRIYSLNDNTESAKETSFVYEKCRDAELQRNVWEFAIRRAILRPINSSTIVWTPPTWAATTSYPTGTVISYTPARPTAQFGSDPRSFYWYTDKPVTGSASNLTPDMATNWHRYFGPITAMPFVATPVTAAVPAAPTLGQSSGGAFGQTIYYVTLTYVTGAGETLPSAEASFTVSADNLLTVTSPAAQAGATGYNVYAATSPNAETLQTSTPIAIGTPWTEPSSGLVIGPGQPITSIASFFAGELTVSGGVVYTSLISNNTDVPPTNNWLPQGGTIAPLNVLYPLSTGPSTDRSTLNAYRLPYGFLRKAPQDPRGDYAVWLGAPSGPEENDWVFENGFLISRNVQPILLRFVADIIDVYEMSPMFCEGLAARVATEIAPSLVSSELLTVTLANTARHYRDEIINARGANAILIGSEAAPVVSYISCRL